ncbi:MAG: hypothetical protein IH989_05555 [Planctomycetes bacterium]|nr:hypothetical protein [Planctomycetota bacterium]
MADPNWLFASTAQSAAAVFAIVGGFIATRVMTLASERATTNRSLAENESTRATLSARESELKSESQGLKLWRALSGVKSTLLYEDKVPPFDVVMRAKESTDFPEDILRAAYDGLLANYEHAKHFFEQHASQIDQNDNFTLWAHKVRIREVREIDDALDLSMLEIIFRRETGGNVANFSGLMGRKTVEVFCGLARVGRNPSEPIELDLRPSDVSVEFPDQIERHARFQAQELHPARDLAAFRVVEFAFNQIACRSPSHIQMPPRT